MEYNRRNFLRNSFASATGLAATTILPNDLVAGNLHHTNRPKEILVKPGNRSVPKESIRFSVIGLNHGHIYGMVDSLIEGGGTLVAVYSREPELLSGFTKHYPNAKVAKSEVEIIDDNSIQLVASAGIPVERAPLGIRVMQSGKDYMAFLPPKRQGEFCAILARTSVTNFFFIPIQNRPK